MLVKFVALCFACTSALAPLAEAESVVVQHIPVADIGAVATRGDTEMNTHRGHGASVWIRSVLYVDSISNAIRQHVTFIIREHGGDWTVLEGGHDRIVYQAPDGQRVLSVDATGGLIQEVELTVPGKEHGFSMVPVGETCWDRLEVRVDAKGGHDNEIAGIKGTIAFRVHLAATK